MDFLYDIGKILRFIEELGEEILYLRRQGLKIKVKKDGTKVTNGDYHSHNRLKEFLNHHYPYPLISEEKENPKSLPMGTQWVLDPIDGTFHYLKGENDFSVMLGLAHNCEPIMALIYQPAHQSGYYSELGKGSYRFTKGGRGTPIKIDLQTPVRDRIFLLSGIRNYADEYKWFNERNIRNYKIKGGIGIKLGAIAEGVGHYYLNFDRPLKVWDVLPSVILAREAGAWVGNSLGGKVTYDESGYSLTNGLCVAPDQSLLPFLQETQHVH